MNPNRLHSVDHSNRAGRGTRLLGAVALGLNTLFLGACAPATAYAPAESSSSASAAELSDSDKAQGAGETPKLYFYRYNATYELDGQQVADENGTSSETVIDPDEACPPKVPFVANPATGELYPEPRMGTLVEGTCDGELAGVMDDVYGGTDYVEDGQ